MTDETPLGRPISQTRGHGTPAGAGTITPKHGGRIGNPPFVPTPEQRLRVRTLAKTMKHDTAMGTRLIAAEMGISRSTLLLHFEDDLEKGRSELVATAGSIMVRTATDANFAVTVPREQLRACEFVLTRMGGWSQKVELSGPNGGPVQVMNYDLSALSDEQKRAALAAIDLMSATAEAAGNGDAS